MECEEIHRVAHIYCCKEIRVSQTSCSFSSGQDDTVYAEHRHVPLKMTDRPPSSPSRFDLKTRIFRSHSQHQFQPPSEPAPTRPKSPVSLFEVVHRPPSQNHPRLYRQQTDLSPKFKSASFQEDKYQPMPSQKLVRPETVPTTPTTYQVKRGGKIYKVVVGYVSPFTSPMQRNELHLKTEGEVDVIMKQIQQQQEKQRTSTRQAWLGPTSQSILK